MSIRSTKSASKSSIQDAINAEISSLKQNSMQTAQKELSKPSGTPSRMQESQPQRFRQPPPPLARQLPSLMSQRPQNATLHDGSPSRMQFPPYLLRQPTPLHRPTGFDELKSSRANLGTPSALPNYEGSKRSSATQQPQQPQFRQQKPKLPKDTRFPDGDSNLQQSGSGGKEMKKPTKSSNLAVALRSTYSKLLGRGSGGGSKVKENETVEFKSGLIIVEEPDDEKSGPKTPPNSQSSVIEVPMQANTSPIPEFELSDNKSQEEPILDYHGADDIPVEYENSEPEYNGGEEMYSVPKQEQDRAGSAKHKIGKPEHERLENAFKALLRDFPNFSNFSKIENENRYIVSMTKFAELPEATTPSSVRSARGMRRSTEDRSLGSLSSIASKGRRSLVGKRPASVYSDTEQTEMDFPETASKRAASEFTDAYEFMPATDQIIITYFSWHKFNDLQDNRKLPEGKKKDEHARDVLGNTMLYCEKVKDDFHELDVSTAVLCEHVECRLMDQIDAAIQTLDAYWLSYQIAKPGDLAKSLKINLDEKELNRLNPKII